MNQNQNQGQAWTKDAKSNKILKIFDVIFHKEKNSNENLSGTILIKNNTIKLITYDGFLEVLELQLEGKKRMSNLEFINGYKNFHSQRLLQFIKITKFNQSLLFKYIEQY